MMKRVSICLSVLALLAGCASKDAPPKELKVVTKEEGVKLKKSGAAMEADAIQPADAQWSIACRQFAGPNHVELAKVSKQQVAAGTGLSGFYVVHEDAISTLYFGFYRYMSPRQAPQNQPGAVADGARAQSDLKKLQSFESNHQKLFPMAFFSPLEPVDPPATAEWDLRNVDREKSDTDPTKAFWSLEIAVYKDSPERKSAAVESVKRLRTELGVKDAYYYHGKSSSSVCIGTWPREAVREQERQSAGNEDATAPFIVLPQALPDGVSGKLHGPDGKPIAAVAPRLDVADPTMLAAMRKYPTRAVNGDDIQRTVKVRGGGVKNISEPSLVIMVPQSETVLDAPDRRMPADPVLGGLPQLPSNGGGSLRSLGQ